MRIPASGWIAFLLGFAFAALMPQPGHPHGDAWWIQQGNYHNPAGQLCCGENDCKPLADDDVAAVQGGWFIKSLNELVPYSEAQPSVDGHFWRCSWPTIHDRKCFFAGPQGS